MYCMVMYYSIDFDVQTMDTAPGTTLHTLGRCNMSGSAGRLDRMHQAALLKIAIQLRKQKLKGFDEIFDDILNEMQLDRAEFQRYVNQHMQTLLTTVKSRGY